MIPRQSNPDINAFMDKMGMKKGDYAALESYYIKRVVDIVSKIGTNYIVWQEPFDNGVKVCSYWCFPWVKRVRWAEI